MALRFPDLPQPNEDFFVDPYYDELQALEQEQFVPGQYRRNPLEVFAGLENQDFRRPTSFGEGFLQGLSGGIGSLGTAASQKRAQFEEADARRKAAFDANRIKRSQELRDMSGKERRDWIEARRKEERENAKTTAADKRRQEDYERDNPVVTPGLLRSKPYLRAQGFTEGMRIPMSALTQPPPEPKDEPLMAIETPNGPVLVRRSQAEGKPPAKGTGGANMPAVGERSQLAADVTAIAQIGDLEKLYRPNFVGPAAGRLGRAQALGIPMTGRLSAAQSDFQGALAQLRNAVINQLSGAAVSESEARRMEQQIPSENDPSEAFEGKLRQTRKNIIRLARLRRETLAQSGVDISGLAPLPEDTDTPPRPRKAKPSNIVRQDISDEQLRSEYDAWRQN